MKNKINILLIIFCSMAIGYWGELVELSASDLVPVSTKMNESNEKEIDNETVSYFEAQSKLDKTGQGGSKPHTFKAFVFKAQIAARPLNTLISPINLVFFDTLKTNNEHLISSIDTQKLYILFHCSKAFLA
jgi:hypothetical protein